MKKNNKNYVTLQVPVSYKFQDLNLSKADSVKALFIINQINFQGDYELYFNKYKKLMGVNSLTLNKILNTLIEANIIQKVKAGVYKQECAVYRMVKPFDIKKDECIIQSFQFEGLNTPIFINRYIADDFKFKDDSSFQPRKKQLLTPGAEDKDSIILAQQQEIEALKQRIAELEAKSNDNTSISVSLPEITETPIKPLKVVADNDVQHVTICQGQYDCNFKGYNSYKNITSGMTDNELLDLEIEILQKIIEKEVNEFVINVKNKQLSFFANSSLKDKSFIKFQHAEMSAA